MAARSNTSVLTMVSMGVLGVAALAFFVTTIVFASRSQQLVSDREQARTQRNEAVRAEESDLFQRLQQQAGRNESVVGYLHGNYQALSDLAVGRRNRSPEQIRETFDEILGEGGYDNLESAVLGMVNRVSTLERELSEARRSAERARTDLANANEELESVRREFEEAFERQRASVDQAFDNASTYSTQLETVKADFSDETERLKRDAAEVARQKDRRINELLDDKARLEQTVEELSREAIQPLASDEGALIDGTVVGTNLDANEVYISLGRGDRLPQSITFQVYSPGTAVQAGPGGEIPAGKATIEVIRTRADTSVARVIRSARGDQILAGDKIVNALYDPNKVYEFVVFGDFDVDGDFIATPQETSEIRALIREWGGGVSSELSGTTDFVVLGERPVLPPEPRIDDPPAVVQRYSEARQEQLKYDRLFENATATYIPILNQNRLFTLTGIDAR